MATVGSVASSYGWVDEYVKSKEFHNNIVWPGWLPGDSSEIETTRGGHDSKNALEIEQERDQAVVVVLENLRKLLEMPLGHFLSHVITRKDFHIFLDSFLRYQDRWFDRSAWIRALEMEHGHGNSGLTVSPHLEGVTLITKRVFTIFQRLVVSLGGRFAKNPGKNGPADDKELNILFKGSKNPSKELSKLLASKGVVSSMHLMDLCVLFGGHNPNEVRVLMNTLTISLPGLMENMENSLQKVSALWKSVSQSFNASEGDEVEDLTKYLLDIIVTIHSLSEAGVTQTVPMLFPKAKLHQRLREAFVCYETCMPRIFAVVVAESATAKRFWQSEEEVAVQRKLEFQYKFWRSKFLQHEFLRLFLGVLTVYSGDEDGSGRLSALLQELLSDPQLTGLVLGDMCADPKLMAGLTKLLETDGDDDVQIQYLQSVFATLPKTPIVTLPSDVEEVKQSVKLPKQENDRENKALESLREFLPHLGVYFAKSLLIAVNWDVEKAVQRVLENNLPSAVRGMDFCQEEPDSDFVPLSKGPDSMAALLNQISTKPASTPTSMEEAGETLNDSGDEQDSEELQEIRARIKQFASKYDEYEDEYDDAYDDNVIVYDAGTSFEAEGIVERRDAAPKSSSIMQPPSSHAKGKKGNEDPSKSQGSQSAPGTWKPGMEDVDGVKRDIHGKRIVEDETDLLKPNQNRARPGPMAPPVRKAFGRGGTRNIGSRPSATANVEKVSSENTSGKAEGGRDESDSKSTAYQRNRNQKQKSSRANHSRKRGAAKKASKGMF